MFPRKQVTVTVGAEHWEAWRPDRTLDHGVGGGGTGQGSAARESVAAQSKSTHSPGVLKLLIIRSLPERQRLHTRAFWFWLRKNSHLNGSCPGCLLPAVYCPHHYPKPGSVPKDFCRANSSMLPTAAQLSGITRPTDTFLGGPFCFNDFNPFLLSVLPIHPLNVPEG